MWALMSEGETIKGQSEKNHTYICWPNSFSSVWHDMALSLKTESFLSSYVLSRGELKTFLCFTDLLQNFRSPQMYICMHLRQFKVLYSGWIVNQCISVHPCTIHTYYWAYRHWRMKTSYLIPLLRLHFIIGEIIGRYSIETREMRLSLFSVDILISCLQCYIKE